MTQRDTILSMIYDAFAELNRQLPSDAQLRGDPETALIGSGGSLDSLGLITFLVSLEDMIQSRLGVSVALVDEELMADETGPFRTAGSLATWIAART